MSRSTLKLPKKPTAAGGTWAPARKPIRGGSQAAKRATPRRADGNSEAPAAPAGKPGQRTVMTLPDPPDHDSHDRFPPLQGAFQLPRRNRSMGAEHPPRIPQLTPRPLAHVGERGDSRVADATFTLTNSTPPSAAATTAGNPAELLATTVPTKHIAPPRQRRSSTAESQAIQADGSGGRFNDGVDREQPTAERPGKRTYPQRGIARSTGARAFPPAPQRPERDALPPTRADAVSPAAAADRASHLDLPADTPAAAASAPRGLAKESPRLSKLVSQLATCSRREADEWIENGWISVDGVVITRLGARVNPKAKIRIKDAASRHQTESVTILYNKACDTPGAPSDDDHEHAVALIRPDNHWPEDNTSFRFQATHLRGLALAGRLDADAGGMLVFTQEGSVARRLTGGDSKLEKEYHVRVEGELSADGLDRLRHGLSLDKVKLLRAQVSWLSEQHLRFVLHENRKRQIQGMCEQVGLRVTNIKRVRIGSVSLGKLAAGQWRYLRADERF